ncbi:MAG: CopG family transcriptional regulator [Candidatus Competibacteraceae bacterium]
MRTTIQLDAHLLSMIEQYARETGQTLTNVIEDTLREMLAQRNKSVGHKPVKLTTVKGKGLVHSEIDLDDSKVLLDLMEQDNASN